MGYQNVEIASIEWTLYDLKLNRLKINNSTIDTVHLGYNIKNLILHKSIDNLKIRNGYINIRQNKDKELIIAGIALPTSSQENSSVPQDFPIQNISIEKLTLNIEADLIQNIQLSGLIQRRANLRDLNFAFQTKTMSPILKVNPNISGSYNKELNLLDFEINAKNSLINIENNQISFGNIIANIELDLAHKNGVSGTVQIDELSHISSKKAFNDLSLNMTIASGHRTKPITFNTEIKNEHIALIFKGEHDLYTNIGHGRLSIPAIEFNNERQPQDISPLLEGIFSQTEGGFSLKTDLNWNINAQNHKNTLTGNARILLKNISTSIEGMRVSGINAVLKTETLMPLSLKKQDISIALINAGIPLTQGLFRFDLSPEKLKILKAEWQFAGGNLKSTPFSIPLKQNDFTTDITISAYKLSLDSLFKLTALEGLSGTGELNGKFPLHITTESIEIIDGYLKNKTKGVIRYTTEDAPEFLKNPQHMGVTDLTKVLENFQYKLLSLDINGKTGQKQNITLKIKGKNPDYYNGHPVNLNLNLDAAIESLFKYNLKAYNIPDSISQKIKEFEQKNAE